jgi:hypothetical protein
VGKVGQLLGPGKQLDFIWKWTSEMRSAAFLKQFAVWLAVAGCCLPQMTLAATPAQTPVVSDVTLHDGNVLVGQVVDSQGMGLANTQVALRSAGGVLATGQTDARGLFSFRGLSTGVYEVAAPAGSGTYRVWANGTAPRAAQPGALVVSGNDVVRGGYGCGPAGCSTAACKPAGCGGVKGFLCNPLVIGGLIAAAIAIPVAVADRGPASPN